LLGDEFNPVFYALKTKFLVGCDKITVRIRSKCLFFEGCFEALEQNKFAWFCEECSGVVRSTKKCGRMLEAGTCVFCIETKYWCRGKKICFQLKWRLKTEAKSLGCFASVSPSCASLDVLKNVKSFNSFWSVAFGRLFLSKFNLLAKWEHEIVPKWILELPFFFDLCVRKNFWERTDKFKFQFFFLSFTD
jgi:hypothetical protein